MPYVVCEASRRSMGSYDISSVTKHIRSTFTQFQKIIFCFFTLSLSLSLSPSFFHSTSASSLPFLFLRPSLSFAISTTRLVSIIATDKCLSALVHFATANCFNNNNNRVIPPRNGRFAQFIHII